MPARRSNWEPLYCPSCRNYVHDADFHQHKKGVHDAIFGATPDEKLEEVVEWLLNLPVAKPEA